MQQSASRFLGHSSVAIRGARDHAFKEAKHTTHFGDAIERGDCVYFRGARVREACINPSRQQGTDQAFRPVHREPSMPIPLILSTILPIESMSIPKGFAIALVAAT
jgi:hypothetical protein